MSDTFLIAPRIDGHDRVEAIRLADANDHPLVQEGRHWHLVRMRAERQHLAGYAIHSLAGPLVGVIVRCRPDWRMPGGDGDTVHSQHWIVLPAMGSVPRRPVRTIYRAVWTTALRYSEGVRADEREHAAAVPVDPMDILDAETLEALTPANAHGPQ